MPSEKITRVVGRAVPVPGDDMDTDRIIPARFMKCVTFDGLGEHLFHDDRFHEDGRLKEHPLDDPRFKGAEILVGGRNFGCGSSREHAPQAVARFGLKALIAESFAEIFFGNCVALGLPCVCCRRVDLDALSTAVAADPQTEVTVDLEASEVHFGGHRVPCTIKENARRAFLDGEWDSLSLLLNGADQVAAVAAKLPYFKPDHGEMEC